MNESARSQAACLRMRHTDERQYHLFVAMVFPLFLVATVTRRLLGLGTGGDGTQHRSIIAETLSAAHSALPFAFRG